jgi:hypothetical protein
MLFALISVRTDFEVDRTVETTHRTDSGPMGIGHPPEAFALQLTIEMFPFFTSQSVSIY